MTVSSGITPLQGTLVKSWWRKLPPKTAGMNESIPEKRVFGIPLTESIKYACSSISYTDNQDGETKAYGAIPTVIAKCGYFLKDQGLFVEGIFRISGNAKRIAQLQAAFDEPDVYGANFVWDGYTAHDAANVMRRFLNYLPEPVIPLDFYHKFKKVMETQQATEERLEAFQSLISAMPVWHQYLLLYILDMLGLFVMTSDVTRMDAQALAAVFVPGILSHPSDELNPAEYKESQRVLEFLILHQAKFAVPPSCLPKDQTLVARNCRSTLGTRSTLSKRNTQQDHRTGNLPRIGLDLQQFDLGSAPTPLHRSLSSTRSARKPAKSADLRRANTTPAKRRPTDIFRVPTSS